MGNWEGPMYVEEFGNYTSDELLTHINYTRGQVLGYESRVKALEKQVAELEQQVEIARQYQRAMDIKAMRHGGSLGGALWLESQPL